MRGEAVPAGCARASHILAVARHRREAAYRGTTAARCGCLNFLAAANLYWEDAARPPPKTQAGLVMEAADDVRAAMEMSMRAGACRRSKLYFRKSTKPKLRARREAAALGGGDSAFSGAHFHRHEFLAAALNFGPVAEARSHSRGCRGRPRHRAARYPELDCVCRIAKLSNSPALETLATFISERKRPRA